MRLFLAIDLPGDLKRKIVRFQDSLSSYRRFIRFSPFENLHITIKFLGEQPEFAMDRIVEISKAISGTSEPFKIDLNRSGVFGGIENARILWLGEDNGNYVSLAERFNRELDVFRREEHKPVCHLTIGRIRGLPKKDAIEILRLCRRFVSDNELDFEVREVALYKSTLLKSGAVYEKIERFKMKGC